ncbi:hypothetical protein CYMTET_22963 [Cymbomonas tetramitiformis]|uniref:Uncharacterized protein n=1 Tax=Cymbomonas tetramitiformis TaxID=36881 RepID=A0AAE0FZE0_9CHLO|nr:hypothetical protein CYMTET_22963 [Cymbomonas tetramitiformis]
MQEGSWSLELCSGAPKTGLKEKLANISKLHWAQNVELSTVSELMAANKSSTTPRLMEHAGDAAIQARVPRYEKLSPKPYRRSVAFSSGSGLRRSGAHRLGSGCV